MYQLPHRDADAHSAVRELIGEHLRIVFAAEVTAPLTGPLAETLRRIEESESRAPGRADAARPEASKPQ
ncbi:MAG: hypothetical protein ABSG76_06045 [Xanthobacteraceae bacterium]|jgi:hypothetical protein